jgi:hypothetical protein
MNEVYRRRPKPKDWPMPMNIVTRQIDVTTNMLAGPYCPKPYIGNEFFIPGTDPIIQCDVHTGGLYPDSSGINGLYPSIPTPGQVRPGTDTGYRPPNPGTTVIVPGSAGSLPRDTSRRVRDTSIFAIPPRDSTTMRTRPPRDTIRPDSTRPRPPRPDSIRPPRVDTTVRVPPPE